MEYLSPFSTYEHTESEFVAGLQNTPPARVAAYIESWCATWRDLQWPHTSGLLPDYGLLWCHAFRLVPFPPRLLKSALAERLTSPEETQAAILALLDNPALPTFLPTLENLAVPKDISWPGFERMSHHRVEHVGLFIAEELHKRSLLPPDCLTQLFALEKKIRLFKPPTQSQDAYGNQSPFRPENLTFYSQEHQHACRQYLHTLAFKISTTPTEISQTLSAIEQIPDSANFRDFEWFLKRLFWDKPLSNAHIEEIFNLPKIYKTLFSYLADHPHVRRTPALSALVLKTAQDKLSYHLAKMLTKKTKTGKSDYARGSDVRLDCDTAARLIIKLPLPEALSLWPSLANLRHRLAWESLAKSPSLKSHVLATPDLFNPFIQSLLTRAPQSQGTQDLLFDMAPLLPAPETSSILSTLASIDLNGTIEWLQSQPPAFRSRFMSATGPAAAKNLATLPREERVELIKKIGSLSTTAKAPRPSGR